MQTLFIKFTSNHHLMKNFILGTLLAFSFNSFSQTIPWATQQPKWVFPIYAKDATGKLDTVFLCYQPGTDGTLSDTSFGEKWFDSPIDFFMYTGSTGSSVDSSVGVDVRDTLMGSLFYDLEVSNAIFPLTFYWDVNLIRSDSLPYPNQPIFPKIWIGFNYGGGNYVVAYDSTFSCNPAFDILVTDTANSFDCNCHRRDSLTLNDWTGSLAPQGAVFPIRIDGWHNCFLSIDEIEKENEIVIYPNPSSGIINLKNLFYEEIIIRNSFGCVIFHSNDFARRPQLDVSFLPNGLYFIELISPKNQSQIINKLIISK